MKQLVKRWLALGMSFAMAFTMIPAGSGDVVKAEENPYGLLAEYDFSDYVKTDDSTLTGVDGDTIALESVGSGEKPALVEDNDRGQVLSLKYLGSGLENKGTAVVPNPFEGEDIEDGLTLNFWTKTETKGQNDGCLISFELAPKSGTTMSSAFDVNQGNIRWNATTAGGGSRYSDIGISGLGLTTSDTSWKMVTMTITKNELKFYCDGKSITYTQSDVGVEAYKENYEEMMKDLVGTGDGVGSQTDENGKKTKVRLGGTFVSYWPSAGALIDEVSFYGKALTAEQVAEIYNDTKDVPLQKVTISSDTTIVTNGDTLQLNVALSPQKYSGTETVTWTAEDTSVLSVDNTGMVTGLAVGTATVTATAGDKSDTITIEVIDPAQAAFNQMVADFTIDKYIVTGDFELPNELEGDEGNASVTWKSSDTNTVSIVTGADGTITGKITVPDVSTKVTLTANIEVAWDNKTYTDEKEFVVIVRPNMAVSNTAIASYHFADYTKTNDSTLTDKNNNTTITLESVGSGVKPELIDDNMRGQVLSLTEQAYNNRAFALLPENPFANQSVENGLTLNFWTNTTGDGGGARCLVDFELAPTPQAGQGANGDNDYRPATLAVNQQMVYWNTTSQGGKDRFTDFATGNLKLNKDNGWTMVTVAFTKTGIALYRNGNKISHTVSGGTPDYENMIKDLTGKGEINTDPTKTNVRLGASLATYWSCAGASLDDVSFYNKALSASEIAALYQETLIPVELESVTVSGSSHSVEEDGSISLSVSVKPENTTVDRTVTWKSSDEAILTVNANGVARGVKAGTATVTATIAGVDSQPFTITVTPAATGFQEPLAVGYYITVYSTEQSFYSSGNRREQEARSVYIAVSKDGENFDVLNNGGAVIYSRAGVGSSQVTKPRIFKESDQFIVEAPDVTASNGIHVYTSADGVNYYQEDLVATTGRTTPNQLRKSSIKLMLHGENILDTDDTITLGNAISLSEDEYNLINNKLGTVVNNGLDSLGTLNITMEETEDLSEALLHEMYPNINATYTDGSIQNFKIDWTDALKDINWTKGENIITGKVVQTKYLNNLKELNGSQLKDDDPENVNPDYPDNINPETGEVYYDATKFIEGMADPYIYWDEKNEYYYMTSSYFPEDGDAMEGEIPDQYDRVVLRRGKTLEDLQTRANQVTIWKVGNQKFTDKDGSQKNGYTYIWAPEIHRVGDYWVVYFTESHDGNNAFNIYCHALILDGDKDPYETALKASNEASQWTDYRMCSTQSSDPFDTSFCLDMTYFKNEEDGESYVIWAGQPSEGNTDLYIAKVDEDNPWKITTVATKLTKAEYGWERIEELVNEGPTILQHEGKIFLCYSGSGTGSEYAIGMLSVDADKDLLNASNWTKSPYPLLSSRDVNGEEGPGHNSFTVDKDGNVIFVYHARPTSHNYQKCGHYSGYSLGDPCRHARLKRVHWAADGTPILKMTYEDELLEEFETVRLTINIGDVETELPVPVTGVTLSPDLLELKVGEENELTATILPVNATHRTLTWDTSVPAVATVVDGKVLAKSVGETIITAEAPSGVKGSCKVKVTASNEDTPPVVEVTSITLNKNTLSLNVGESETLTATVVPSDAAVTWSSSNDEKATVDENGKVTAVSEGNATITAKAGDKEATCEVEVTASGGNTPSDVAVTGITLNKTSLSLKAGAVETLTATITPGNATNKTVTWTSSNSAIASVNEGKVTAVKEGNTTITATAGGKSATCAVTVTADTTGTGSSGTGTGTGSGSGTGSSSEVALTGITLSKTLKLGVKETYTLKAALKPANTTVKTAVSWKSSNTKVAKVNKSGKITTKKKGTTTITASIGNIKATCKVTVCAAPTKITLKKTKVSLNKGKTAQISVKAFKPKKAYCSIFSYSVKNKKIATVSSTGKITAKKKGSTTITVTCKNNKKAKATIKVTVK